MKVWTTSCPLLMLLGSVLATGCQSTPQNLLEPDDLAEIGSLIDPIDARDLGYALQWATHLGISGDQALSHVKVLGDVVVCIEAPANMVTAISVREGHIIWRKVVGKPADKLFAPVRSNDRLLINSEQLLYSIDIKTGRLIQASRLQSLVNHAPAVVGETVIFGGLNHRVFAHNFNAGYTKWAYQMTERVFAPPASFGAHVFVADGNGVYAMFVAQTGQLLWKGRTFARISAQPEISRIGVFVAGEDHSLYALDRTTGRDRWIYHTTQPLLLSPHVFPHFVILPIADEGLVALHARTGLEKWKLPFIATPILIFEDTLLLNTEFSLLVLEIGSGKILTEVPVHRLKTVIEVSDKQLLLVSPNGRLLLLVPVA